MVSFTVQDVILQMAADNKYLLKMCYGLARLLQDGGLANNIHIAKEVPCACDSPGFPRLAIVETRVLSVHRSSVLVYHLRFSMLPTSWSEGGWSPAVSKKRIFV